jgi:cation transporter-like permease
MVRAEASFRDSKLFLYVILSIVMSGYDAVATMEHIGRGVALEGNPLMASLINKNALLFFAVKMLVTAIGLLVCYAYCHKRAAQIGIKTAVAVYSLVCVYHALIVFFAH